MQPSDFKYEKTKLFVEDSTPVEQFDPQNYTEIDESFYKDLTKDEQENALTVPLKITAFPWNPDFEGLAFVMGKVDIQETNDGNAQLSYNYSVLNNPNGLDLAAEEDVESRDTPDNELLDVFVGRMVESLLFRMSQDKDFLQKVSKEAGE